MRNTKIRFQITEEQIRRAQLGHHPMALALRKAGITGYLEVRPLNTIESDGTGRKLRTLWHSPPVARWLRNWQQGQKVGPIGLILDHENRRINSIPGAWRGKQTT